LFPRNVKIRLVAMCQTANWHDIGGDFRLFRGNPENLFLKLLRSWFRNHNSISSEL